MSRTAHQILWAFILSSLVFDFFCLSWTAQKSAIKSRPRPTGLSGLAPDKSEHDFGVLLPHTTTTHIFKLKNKTDKPMKIGKVEVSCGCTSTYLSEGELEPGQTGELEVSFESGSIRGPFRKRVRVETEDDEYSVRLYVRGVVKPYYRKDPDWVLFGQVKLGQSARQTVVISRNSNDVPLELTGPFARNSQITAENLKYLEAQQAYSFDVVFTPTKIGETRGIVRYKTGNPDQPGDWVRYSGEAVQ